ncbi:MAG: O-methyltransferase [Bacilli bacterium]|nr:O-methyltransferase [Bacilli bacterium]MBN2877065.1 O-methyltransferase [Bacilli bacterium]
MNDYLNRINPSLKTPVIEDLLVQAEKLNTPIIREDAIRLILQLIQLSKTKKILEIGTAIGYSAIMMATYSDCHVTTIERDEESFKIAKKNIAKANLTSQIDVIHMDANLYTPHEEEMFDLLFIDAAKANYERFFERFEAHVKPGGLIICDNLLFHGLVEHPEETHSKNTKSLVKKIDNFNRFLTSKEGYETTLYEIGDGLSISIKKE